MPYVCELVLLLSVVFHLVKAVRNASLVLLLAKHLPCVNQWTVIAAVVKTCVFDRAGTFSLQG